MSFFLRQDPASLLLCLLGIMVLSLWIFPLFLQIFFPREGKAQSFPEQLDELEQSILSQSRLLHTHVEALHRARLHKRNRGELRVIRKMKLRLTLTLRALLDQKQELLKT